MLNTVSDAITVIDQNLNVLFQNEAVQHIYGARIGERCFEAYRGRQEPCENCIILDVIKDGKPRRAAMAVHCWGINLSFTKVPELLKWVALCCWVSGFGLLFIGRFGLGTAFRIGAPKEWTNLTVDGLFRFSRNPMYFGVYATLFAVVLYTLNPLVVVIGIFVVAVHHKIVLAEEQFLRMVFNEQFLAESRVSSVPYVRIGMVFVYH